MRRERAEGDDSPSALSLKDGFPLLTSMSCRQESPESQKLWWL